MTPWFTSNRQPKTGRRSRSSPGTQQGVWAAGCQRPFYFEGARELDERTYFLTHLFRDKPDELFYLIWSIGEGGSKRSRWFTDPAAEFKFGKREDVYVGAGLSPQDFGEHARCPAADVAGITALWADVDIRDDVHKKENLPPTRAAALKIINGMPLRCSLLIDSGHGYQAWWLLREPWIFADANDRERAGKLVAGWQRSLQNLAAAEGWAIDSTGDLARVMRLPGTTNNKRLESPRRVSLVETPASVSRYDPSDLVEYACLSEPGARQTVSQRASVTPISEKVPQTTVDSADIALNAQASPPSEKFMALLENEPQFKKTWGHTRKDLPSDSEYDLALADYAAQAGWTYQETADLLIAHRRSRGSESLEKAMRTGGASSSNYIAHTVVTAHNRMRLHAAANKISSRTLNAGDAGDRTDIDEVVTEALGFRVLRVLKYLSTPASYRIETEHGPVTFDSIDMLESQTRFRRALMEQIKKWIKPMKPKVWGGVMSGFLAMIEEVDIGRDATEGGKMLDWLRTYVHDFAGAEGTYTTPEAAWGRERPFTVDGEIYIFGAMFSKWLATRVDLPAAKLTPQRMGRLLKEVGCRARTMNVEIGGRQTTRSSWILPAEEIAK